eukprot:10620367-Alexandrium_andersonii.AAC.1
MSGTKRPTTIRRRAGKEGLRCGESPPPDSAPGSAPRASPGRSEGTSQTGGCRRGRRVCSGRVAACSGQLV